MYVHIYMSVLLRQNPHSVHEWLKRAALFEKEPAKAIQVYIHI